MWKEAGVAKLLPGGTEEDCKKSSVSIVRVLAKIRTMNIPSKIQKLYFLSWVARYELLNCSHDAVERQPEIVGSRLLRNDRNHVQDRTALWHIRILGFWVVTLRSLPGGYHEVGGSMSVYIYKTTRCHNPEKQDLNHHRNENFKTYIDFISFCISNINVYFCQKRSAQDL
jgi:hypothetical protein